ncbi:MAG: hypothetical protein LBJ23_01550, partial [Tannerella sp.]|nr:hypothetical protein [Tannerella sp.]
WLNDFVTYLESPDVITRLYIDPSAMSDLKDRIKAYRIAFDGAEAHNAGKADANLRRTEKKEVSRFVRQFVNIHLRYNEHVTDVDRINLGIRVKKKTRFRQPDIGEYPEIEVNTYILRRVGLRFLNREHRVAKPEYVHGIDVRYAVLPSDVTPVLGLLTESTFYTRARVTMEFDDTQRGKMLALCARYVGNTGKKGPFGLLVTIFIP